MFLRLVPKFLAFLLSVPLCACIARPLETIPVPDINTLSTQPLPSTATFTAQPTATVTQVTPTPSPVTIFPSPEVESQVTSTPSPAFQMCSPLAWETIPELWEIITNPFNYLGPGHEDGHHGVDLAHYRRKGHLSMLGEEITSVLPGRTAASIINRLPYGNMVIVETPYSALPSELASTLQISPSESLYLLYAHMLNPPEVTLEDPVTCGQLLGQVGTSGLGIVNEHLHLETRLGPPGISFESMDYYDPSAKPEEMAAYVRWRTSGEFRPFDPMRLFAAYLAGIGLPVPTTASSAGGGS